jgi:hypothetical protein
MKLIIKTWETRTDVQELISKVPEKETKALALYKYIECLNEIIPSICYIIPVETLSKEVLVFFFISRLIYFLFLTAFVMHTN